MAGGGSPDRFGRYRVIRRIAGGGMAEIFLASTDGFDGCARPVVVKRILPRQAADLEAVRLFLDEARVISSLSHHNIVDFYDLEALDGQHFMVLEYLRGADALRILRTALSRGRQVPLDAAIAIAIGVCAGLHHAHERLGADGRPLHIVHRDVSPANIFVTLSGGVKLIDFGVAKSSRRSVKARGGTIKGKISYLSPEQGRGETVDRRSDLFSLSIVLWELTTGTRLFHGGNDYQVLKSILDGEARRPSGVVADYPPELEAIVMKGLRRERERRYQTAEELQIDLEQFAVERKLLITPRVTAKLMSELFAAEAREEEAADRAPRPAPPLPPLPALSDPSPLGRIGLNPRTTLWTRLVGGRPRWLLLGIGALGLVLSVVLPWSRTSEQAAAAQAPLAATPRRFVDVRARAAARPKLAGPACAGAVDLPHALKARFQTVLAEPFSPARLLALIVGRQ